ncbi:MAG: HigA family addiction module antitoxin [Methylocystis sp.]|uniref:HigA family addiction module antitoxin n=1 Tax=Methylocystis sp. TaxID=1911079 RepID=UPI003DA2DA81
MGRYYEALTRLLMRGAFPAPAAGEPARAPPPEPPKLAAAPLTPPPLRQPRAAHAPPPRPAAAVPARAHSDRRAAQPRKFRPATLERVMAPHPGQVLAQHLADLGLTASDLARDIDVPVNRVTAIINGQRGVTADTALRLGHWFGVDAEDWLGLQLEYELALARHEAGVTIRKLPRLADRVA